MECSTACMLDGSDHYLPFAQIYAHVTLAED